MPAETRSSRPPPPHSPPLESGKISPASHATLQTPRAAFETLLEGRPPCRPIIPARLRGLVCRKGAGLRPARMGRHGSRPSKVADSDLPALRLRAPDTASLPRSFILLLKLRRPNFPNCELNESQWNRRGWLGSRHCRGMWRWCSGPQCCPNCRRARG